MIVGGVWRDNSYPGCAYDVESHLYSFSFAPNPNWSRKFSEQKEIYAYLKDRAKQFDLFQRTPAWVVPRNDVPINPVMKKLYHGLSPFQKAARLKIYGAREFLVMGFRHPKYLKIVQNQALKNMRGAIKDPEILDKITPNYTIGCKHIPLSDAYYPALAQDNVEVITSAIKEVTESSVVAADGSQREVDTIIFGAGFQDQDPPLTHHTYGKEGRSIAANWAGSPKAYFGTTVAGFPNLFVLQGPNTGIEHSSVILMMEAQVNHIIKVMKYMNKSNIEIIEPTERAQKDYVDKVERSMQGTVWTSGGCDSWYLDKSSRNSTLWPGFTFSSNRLLSSFNSKDYEGRRVASFVKEGIE